MTIKLNKPRLLELHSIEIWMIISYRKFIRFIVIDDKGTARIFFPNVSR